MPSSYAVWKSFGSSVCSRCVCCPICALVMVDLRLFVCPWLCLPWILPFPVSMNAPCVPHDNVFNGVLADAVESVCFPLSVPCDAVVRAAPAAGSNVSAGSANGVEA